MKLVKGLYPFQLQGQNMKFHFLIHKEQGWYLFDKDGFLQKRAKQNADKQIKVQGEELHHEFIRILNPILDFYKSIDKQFKNNNKTYGDIVFHLNDNKKLREDVEFEILIFANKFGMGTSNGFMDFGEMLHGLDQDPDTFISEHKFTVFNLVETALAMSKLLVDRQSFELIPTKMKELCNRVGRRLVPQINGGIYYETSDIFASMFWTMAFTEFQHQVKECRWCSAPLLTDVRASFCKAPRQCKNKFNNSKRPTKKGVK